MAARAGTEDEALPLPKPRRSGRPSTNEAGRKHEALLEAALEEFSSHGFHGASIRAIAERAGVSTRTLYNHYAEKEALFEACLVSAAPGPIQPDNADGSLFDKLVSLARHQLTEVGQERQICLARIIFRESTRFPQLKEISRQQFARFQLAPVCNLLESHGYAPDRAQELAAAYIALVFEKWQYRAIYDEAPMTAKEIAAHAAFTTRLFLDGASALTES